jgi:hypothetical protein
MQIGVKHRHSRAPAARPQGGGRGQIARLAAVTCPQTFVHTYPQIPVDNSEATPNVFLNLWITQDRLYIMDVAGISVSLRYA